MKEIILTKGLVALVDDEDFERLNSFKWYAKNNKGSGRPTDIFYACRRGKLTPRGKTKTIYMHRFVLNYSGRLVVDHADGNTLNNQKSNLSKMTKAENNRNMPWHRAQREREKEKPFIPWEHDNADETTA